MTRLTITGMTCNHCRKAVQDALESVEGARDVQVDLDTGSAVVGGQPDVRKLIAAVEDEGYDAAVAS